MKKLKQPCVYIMANRKRGTIYTGVTADINKRKYEHVHDIFGGFTSKYNCKLLVFMEFHENMESAIAREKTIKKWPREYKYNVIEESNYDWNDLEVY